MAAPLPDSLLVVPAAGRARLAARCARGALACLREMHGAGACHGSLRPESLTWDGGNACSVRLARADGEARAGSGWDDGTYASPRVCRGTVMMADGEARDDLCSLLYIVVEAIAGALPWADSDTDARANIKAHCHEVPNMLWGVDDDMPTPLSDFALAVSALGGGEVPDYDALDACLAALAGEGGAPPQVATPHARAEHARHTRNDASDGAPSPGAAQSNGVFVIPRRSSDANGQGAGSQAGPLPYSRSAVDMDEGQICIDFLLKGACERGRACRQLHPANGNVPNGKPRGLCLPFLLGRCRSLTCLMHHLTPSERRRYLTNGTLPEANRVDPWKRSSGDSLPAQRDDITKLPPQKLLKWYNESSRNPKPHFHKRPSRADEVSVQKLAQSLAEPQGCLPRGLFNHVVWLRLHWAAIPVASNALRRIWEEVKRSNGNADADPAAEPDLTSHDPLLKVPALRSRLLDLIDEEQALLPWPAGRRKRARDA